MGSEIIAKNVNPVEELKIPVRPGVTVLCGKNDCGKSLTLESVSRLAGGDGTVTCRQGAVSGSIEGLGAKITVRQSPRRSGELECLTLEGTLDISKLVDPRIIDPIAADRQRIKELLRLTGAEAKPELFDSIMPSIEVFNEVCTAEIRKCNDLVEMAAILFFPELGNGV